MPLQPIPPEWTKAVCGLLATEDRRKVRFTEDARNRFEADFSGAWTYELYPALRKALAVSGVTGCPKTMDRPPGETWEFYFSFRSERCYGKILLSTDRQSIIVFSAHRPLKPRLDCE